VRAQRSGPDMRTRRPEQLRRMQFGVGKLRRLWDMGVAWGQGEATKQIPICGIKISVLYIKLCIKRLISVYT
jgi:hypothetical protein